MKKTRRQKVFATLIACLLCASFFVVPVSAETQYDFSLYAPEYSDNYYFRVTRGNKDDSQWLDFLNWISMDSAVSTMYYDDDEATFFDFYMPNVSSAGSSANEALCAVFLGNFRIAEEARYQESDTVWIDAGRFILGSDRKNFNVNNMRFSLRAITDSGISIVIASTDWQSISIGSSGPRMKEIDYPRMNFTFNQNYTALGLVLCVDFAVSATDPTTEKMILMCPNDFKIHYTQGLGPNTPIYPAPDQGNIGQMESAEDQLMQGGQAGLDAGADTFRDFADAFNSHPNLARCFVKISDIFVRLSGLPQMNTLVHISLSLGLFASLLGLAGSIVSAADRKAGREAAAAARASKSK